MPGLRCANLGYDGFNRFNTLRDTRNAAVVDTLGYDFSPGGLLNKVRDGKGNETNYVYHALGRLSGIWAPNYGTISYRYERLKLISIRPRLSTCEALQHSRNRPMCI